jgi:hypothetical protein
LLVLRLILNLESWKSWNRKPARSSQEEIRKSTNLMPTMTQMEKARGLFRRSAAYAALLLIACEFVGCAGFTQQAQLGNGTGNGPTSASVSSVTVTPGTASVTASSTVQFAAVVQGTASNKAVVWTASSGSISASGLFKAPAGAGTAKVTASSVASPTVAGSATVSVTTASVPTGPPSGGQVQLPKIDSLTATPSTLQAGQTSVLQWSAEFATSLDIAGVGEVTGGNVAVAPAQTTTYTLTASNVTGSVSKSVTVIVNSAEAIGSLTISPNEPGLPIAPTFMGFSHEFGWSIPEQLMGVPGQGTNPLYRQLANNLLAYGAGPLVIRMGGNSTDTSGEPTSETMAPMAQVAKDINAKFTLGVNLGSDNVQLAVDQAKNYTANMPPGSLAAIEIGNEPDLYAKNGTRGTGYTFANYFSDFAGWRGQVTPQLPNGLKLMGPSWAITGAIANLPTFLSQEEKYLAIVSQHNYAGSACNGQTNPSNYLLQPTATTKAPHTITPGIQAAHSAGSPFRMGEMNSISCGGETGVSDIFASALWSIDQLFEFANAGVDGVNIHTANGGAYALFQFNSTTKNGLTTFSLASVRPEYYGLLFFQQATAHHSNLLPVTLSTKANLKAWATVDSTGVVRVALINKDQTEKGLVNVSLAGLGTGSVTRLSASNYQATKGITLAGQTFDGSTDGTIQGGAVSETVNPVGGIYSVAIPPTSAVLLTIQP